MQLNIPLKLTDIEIVKHLFIYFIVLAAVIFGLVVFFVTFYSRRYSASKVPGTPEQNHGNRKFEIVLTTVAVLVTVFFLIMTLSAMQEIQTVPDKQVADIEITGHQWWWEAKYPDGNLVTANEIHIPVGKQVLLKLTSGDVIHSWWVPALGRKMDMIPGLENHMWMIAEEPGEYLGTCSEFCGMQHARMRIRVIAEPQADFDRWKTEQLKPAIAANTVETALGKQLFEQKTCSNCHTIGGTSANGKIGPDLTHFASRKWFLSDFKRNNIENLHDWLKDPQQIKKGVNMPDFILSDKELNALTAYIHSLK